MRRFFTLLLITLSFVPVVALAAPNIGLGSGKDDLASGIASSSGYNVNIAPNTLTQSVGKVIKVALSFVGTIFFILTVYAGFLWMTAQGNEEQVGQAQGILKMATIGLFVIVMSYTITNYVVKALEKSTAFSSSESAYDTSCSLQGGTCKPGKQDGMTIANPCQPKAVILDVNKATDCPQDSVCCK